MTRLSSILNACASFSFTIVALLCLRFGYLCVATDAMIKISLTYAYAHRREASTKSRCWVQNEIQKLEYSGAGVESVSTFQLARRPGSNVCVQNDNDNAGRAQTSKRNSSLSLEQAEAGNNSGIIGTVVGWREDARLYRTCLEGFVKDPTCSAVVAGIDGDSREDMAMMVVFQEVRL